jgi:alpha-L-fucosidase
MKIFAFLFFTLLTGAFSTAQSVITKPVPSTKPGIYQLQQIKRKYGMFIHFGINTFYEKEWTDASLQYPISRLP